MHVEQERKTNIDRIFRQREQGESESPRVEEQRNTIIPFIGLGRHVVKTRERSQTPLPDVVYHAQRFRSNPKKMKFTERADAKTLKNCMNDSDCAKHDDLNVCNGKHYCNKQGSNPKNWTCVLNLKTVITCKPSNKSCKVSACNSKTGKCELLNAQEGLSCDADGQACTKGDTCIQGGCVSGKWDYANPQCQCFGDGDCAIYEDGDVCNGTLYCDKTKHKCTLNPATIKKCPSLGDTACSTNTCNPLSGACTMKPVIDEKSCDDGNFCTVNDTCKAGTCMPGKNTCECMMNADCGKPQDLCSGVFYCNAAIGKCVLNVAKKVVCQSVNDTACLKNTCNPKSGTCEMAFINEGKACDADGNWCTVGDICATGVCKAGPNKCQCQKDADCASQEDGIACNGTLYCDKKLGKCKINPATVQAKCK